MKDNTKDVSEYRLIEKADFDVMRQRCKESSLIMYPEWEQLERSYEDAHRQTMKDSREVYSDDEAGLEALDYYEAHCDLMKGYIKAGTPMKDAKERSEPPFARRSHFEIKDKQIAVLSPRNKNTIEIRDGDILHNDVLGIDYEVVTGVGLWKLRNGTDYFDLNPGRKQPSFVDDLVTTGKVEFVRVDEKDRGLYQKYKVERYDGKLLKGGAIVLEWGDINARAGICAFKGAVRKAGYTALADDLDKRLKMWTDCIPFCKIEDRAVCLYKGDFYRKVDNLPQLTDVIMNAMNMNNGEFRPILDDEPVQPVEVDVIKRRLPDDE